ncbi:hypothetical protein CZ765_12730 [Corynebacterium casei]|nr:hypothetical protein CZ765_12730 [Corynebacterium casei]
MNHAPCWLGIQPCDRLDFGFFLAVGESVRGGRGLRSFV